MGYRKFPLIEDKIYHVYNRSIGQQPIFLYAKYIQRAIEIFKFYKYGKLPLRFSYYIRLPKDQKEYFFKKVHKDLQPVVDIICYCLMPNHFHFLLKNATEKGIKQFISNFQNSYAKYFNIKENRSGSLFQQNFKAVRIESEEQLVHISRYIHLNPVTSYIIEANELETYPWSSYPQYINHSNSEVSKELILQHFRNISDYKKFVMNQVDYQRDLARIKHLVLE